MKVAIVGASGAVGQELQVESTHLRVKNMK